MLFYCFMTLQSSIRVIAGDMFSHCNISAFISQFHRFIELALEVFRNTCRLCP